MPYISSLLGGRIWYDSEELVTARPTSGLQFQYGTVFGSIPASSAQFTGDLEYQEEVEDTTNMKLVNTFRIGCDPEFLAFDREGKHQNVASLVHLNSKLGWDHSGHVGELRPSPCKSAHSLMKGLRALIQDPRLHQESVGKLRGGAYVETEAYTVLTPTRTNVLGGHIHIDLSPYPSREEMRDQNGGAFDPENLEPYEYSTFSKEHGWRIRALDQLTDRLEQLDILPKEESEKRRNTTTYGKWGSFKVQNNSVASVLGGSNPSARVEYRAMASWLLDPKVAFLALTGAKLCSAYPKESLELLGKERDSFRRFRQMFEAFGGKDIDAKRATALLEQGLKSMVVDPDSDFRSRWVGEAEYLWR